MSQSEYTILVPLQMQGAAARELLEIAAAMVPVHEGAARGRVVALGIVEIPDALGFGEGASAARLERQRLGRLLRLKQSPSMEVRPLVRVTTQVWEGILEAAREEEADLILFGWKGWTGSEHRIFGGTIDEVVRNAPCDIAVVKQRPLGGTRRILVPVRGGPHARLTLELALGLAERYDATVTALHIMPPGLPAAVEQAERQGIAALLADMPLAARVQQSMVVAASVEQAILQEAARHQLVIMGATPGEPDTPFLFGDITEAVAQRLDT